MNFCADHPQLQSDWRRVWSDSFVELNENTSGHYQLLTIWLNLIREGSSVVWSYFSWLIKTMMYKSASGFSGMLIACGCETDGSSCPASVVVMGDHVVLHKNLTLIEHTHAFYLNLMLRSGASQKSDRHSIFMTCCTWAPPSTRGSTGFSWTFSCEFSQGDTTLQVCMHMCITWSGVWSGLWSSHEMK